MSSSLRSSSSSHKHSSLYNNTRLFTRGVNAEGQLGVVNKDRSEEFIEVTSLLNSSEEESRRVLSMIDKIGVGRSSLIFSTSNNRVFVCGMNNYNQLGLDDESAKFLFRPIDDLLGNELKRAKIVEEEKLEIALDRFSASAQTRQYLSERLNMKFDSIRSVDFIECGWFHSLIVLNKNILLGVGHSYFGQLYGADFTKNFQYLNSCLGPDFFEYSSTIKSIEEDGVLIDPFNARSVTHLSCGTFSSSIVFNNCQLYSCGEVVGPSNGFLMDISEEFNENNFIDDLYHLDSGVCILTNNYELIFVEKDKEEPTRRNGIIRASGGHMCSDMYYIEADSPNYLKKVSSDEEVLPLWNISSIRHPLTIFPGYYNVFMVSEDKYIHTDASFADLSYLEDEVSNEQDLFLTTFLGPRSKISDEGNGLLAKYLLRDQYSIHKIGSGSDLSFVVIHQNSSRSEEEMKRRLHKQSNIDSADEDCISPLCDLVIKSQDYQRY